MKTWVISGALLLASACVSSAWAQEAEKAPVGKQQKHIKIVTIKDGKKEVIDETFEGEMPAHLKEKIEKLKADGTKIEIDQNIGQHKVVVIHKGHSSTEISSDDKKDCHKMMIFSTDEKTDGKEGKEFTFHFDSKDGEKIEIKTEELEENEKGEKRVFRFVVLQEIEVEDVKETDELPANARIEKQKMASEAEAQTLQVYPNPAENGQFTLKFKLDGKGATDLKIYDLKGKVAYEESLGEDFSGAYDKQIRVPDLQQGMYILRIAQGEKVLTKKLVVR